MTRSTIELAFGAWIGLAMPSIRYPCVAHVGGSPAVDGISIAQRRHGRQDRDDDDLPLASIADMEQIIAIGQGESMALAVGQIDAILAGPTKP